MSTVQAETLRQLFIEQLKDLYSVEKQLSRALPKLMRASGESLAGIIKSHLKETKQQTQRLEHLFTKLDFQPGAHRCKGMAGLLRDAKHAFRGAGQEEARDAAVAAALRRIEHFEIAAYDVARSLAEKLQEEAAAELLQDSLNEEQAADSHLANFLDEQSSAAQSTAPSAEQPAVAVPM
jgi:ferritin-like metal-binding protein YciE